MPNGIGTIPEQPTQAERIAKLQSEAATDRATYKATRTRGAAIGNLTRGQTGGGH